MAGERHVGDGERSSGAGWALNGTFFSAIRDPRGERIAGETDLGGRRASAEPVTNLDVWHGAGFRRADGA